MPFTHVGGGKAPQAGTTKEEDYATPIHDTLELFLLMAQGRLEGDRLGFKSGGFYLQDAGDGLPHMMVRLPDLSYEDKGIIGSSIITDKYVYTEPFGGLQYKGAGEEWDYHSIRTTAWGKGTGVAVGNYDNYLVLACNTGGVKMVYEKGGEYKHELPINDSTNLITSKRISVSLKTDDPMMIYGGDVSLPPIAETSEVYYRQWATTEGGTIIHETISDRRWNSTNDPFYLDRFKAEKVTFTEGATTFHVEASEPMPVADNGGAIDIILHWEFKEAVTVYGDTADNVKFNLHYEEGAVEQVATQEWTKEQPVELKYRTITDGYTTEELIVSQGDNINIHNLTGAIALTVADGVKSFSIRDVDGSVNQTVNVKVNIDGNNSIQLVKPMDNVLVTGIDTVWSYYNYRNGNGGLI